LAIEGKKGKEMLPAVVFYGGIVVSLSCTVYRWGTFIEAELVRVDMPILRNLDGAEMNFTAIINILYITHFLYLNCTI
jgi:hypothetical protein